MIPLVSFRGKGTCWHSKINIEKKSGENIFSQDKNEWGRKALLFSELV